MSVPCFIASMETSAFQHVASFSSLRTDYNFSLNALVARGRAGTEARGRANLKSWPVGSVVAATVRAKCYVLSYDWMLHANKRPREK
eukprot:3717701-Pleurochrysis_carterae.AAC.2